MTRSTFKIIQGTLAWVIVTLFVVYAFCLNTASAVFSEAIASTLKINNYEISMAMGAFILGFSCFQIPIGYLLDRHNAKYIVSVGILLLALGNIAISVTKSLALFSLANFVQGIGASFAFLSASVLISLWFPQRLFPILLGLTQSVSCIAAGILHYIFTMLLINHSWNELYQILFGFGFFLFLLSVFFLKAPDHMNIRTPLSLKISLNFVFKNKQILLCSIAAALSFGTLLSYASFWYLDVLKYYSIEKLDSVAISGAIFFGMGVGTPLISWISNLIKSRIKMLYFSLIFGVISLLLGLFLPHFNTHILMASKITSFFIGFFLSGTILFYTLVMEKSAENYRGVAMSVLNTLIFLFYTSMLFIPLLFVSSPHTAFYQYLWVLPFCIMLSILLLTFIKDSYSLKRI